VHDLGPKIRQALSSNEEDDEDAASRVSRTHDDLIGLILRETDIKRKQTKKHDISAKTQKKRARNESLTLSGV